MKNASSNQSDVANHPDSRQSTKSLTVTLPDQQHCYFVTENEEASMKCCVISSIPFRYLFDLLIFQKVFFNYFFLFRSVTHLTCRRYFPA